MADTITIQVALGAEGEPARSITLRRPTLGELDVGLLARLVANCGRLSRRLAEIEATPAPGSAVKSANALWLVGETGEEIAKRVKACLDATAPADAIEALNALDPSRQMAALFAIAQHLIAALAPVDKLPK